ncbi:MAG: hypothetical protein ABIT96_02550 [Ferruginibacter sp.]
MNTILFIAGNDFASCFTLNYISRCLAKSGGVADLLGTVNAAFITKGEDNIRDWVSRDEIMHIDDFIDKRYSHIIDFKGVDFITDHLKRLKKSKAISIPEYISGTGDNYADILENCMKAIGAKDDGWGWNLKLHADHKINSSDLPTSHLSGYITLALSNTDNFGSDVDWKNVLSRIPYPVVIIGRNEVCDLATEIASHDNVKIYSACGKFDMYEFADIISRSRLLLTHENIWLYLGIALKQSVVAINSKVKEGVYTFGYGSKFLKSLNALPVVSVILKKRWFTSRRSLENKLVSAIENGLKLKINPH